MDNSQKDVSVMSTVISQLLAWAPMASKGYEVPAAGQVMLNAANELEAQATLITELVGALENFKSSIYEMNAAMRDGVNVQGAFSRWTAAEERVDAVLTKAKDLQK